MTESATQSPSPRVARKRAAARARMLEAAKSLFRENGVESVTISDITRAADVGHGTFYLHFRSKHEVLLAILLADAATTDAAIQQRFGPDSDPADVLATSARTVGRAILSDPLWRWFLAKSGVPGEVLARAFGRFGQRDLEVGIASGRFQTHDPRATAVFCLGGYVSSLLAAMTAPAPEPLIDNAVESILRLFGLPDEEASRIAHGPLDQ